jgi:nitroreductase
VEKDVLVRVLDAARYAPSGCNYQPWHATVLTGEPLQALREKLRLAEMKKPEYDWDAPSQVPEYKSRLVGLSIEMFKALGITREDKQGRAAIVDANRESFGAPALLLCHFPRFVKEAQWSDTGMWLQTIMLLLREEGLDSCPQEYMAYFADTIMDHIEVDRERHMFFCGLAIGYRDEDAPVNAFDRPRVPLDDHVTLRGFDNGN